MVVTILFAIAYVAGKLAGTVSFIVRMFDIAYMAGKCKIYSKLIREKFAIAYVAGKRFKMIFITI